jgi:hypothetical protein
VGESRFGGEGVGSEGLSRGFGDGKPRLAMEQLPTALLQVILAKVSAPDCARAACVARFLKQAADQDALWESHCCADFPVTRQLDPFDRPCVTWKVSDTASPRHSSR